MPVQKKIDSKISFTMDDLDKAAADAKKQVDSRVKEYEMARKKAEKALSKSPIFSGSTADVVLPSGKAIPEGGTNPTGGNSDDLSMTGTPKKPGRTPKRNLADKVLEDKSFFDKMIGQKFGINKAHYLSDFLRNPQAAIINIGTKYLLPLLIAKMIIEVANSIVKELQKHGGPMDRWVKNRVDNRVDVFRDKEIQATVIAGFWQLIITDESGGSSTLEAVNTYETVENKNNRDEDLWTIRYQDGT